jgi:amino acid transporter
MFNTAFAAIKVTFLLVFFIASMTAAFSKRPDTGLTDFSESHPSRGGFESLSAMIYVTFTFQGWEHTNYVSTNPQATVLDFTDGQIAGEIEQPKKALRRGLYSAIALVSVLYVLVTVGFVSTSAIFYDSN